MLSRAQPYQVTATNVVNNTNVYIVFFIKEKERAKVCCVGLRHINVAAPTLTQHCCGGTPVPSACVATMPGVLLCLEPAAQTRQDCCGGGSYQRGCCCIGCQGDEISPATKASAPAHGHAATKQSVLHHTTEPT